MTGEQSVCSRGCKRVGEGGTRGGSGSPSQGEARARVSVLVCATVTAASGLGRRKNILKEMAECFLYFSRGR